MGFIVNVGVNAMNVVYLINFAFLGAILLMNAIAVRRVVRSYETREIRDNISELQTEIGRPLREHAENNKDADWELEYTYV